MKTRSRSLITILIALAFAGGIAGSGCKRARHAAASASDVSTLSANNAAQQISHAASSLAKPADLARKDLGSVQEHPKPIGPMCYVEAFRHKPTPGDTDEETSSHHKNLMTLAHAGVNTTHICVRVNGIPVKFSHVANRKGDQILIGAIAGPTAKITVSYCVGKLTCPEVSAKDCSIPKDEFMDALGGGSEGDEAPAAQWEGTTSNAKDAKLNADVKKELSDIDGVGSGASDDTSARGPASMPIFKGWIEDQNTPACPQQAS